MHWWDRLQPVNARLRAHFSSPSEGGVLPWPGGKGWRPHPVAARIGAHTDPLLCRTPGRQRPCAQCENGCLLAAILIFAGTYFVLAVGRIPFLRVDRTGAAIVGASLMLAFNVLTVEEAYAAINYDT